MLTFYSGKNISTSAKMDLALGKSSLDINNDENDSNYSGIVKYVSNKEIQTKVSLRSTYEEVGHEFNVPASFGRQVGKQYTCGNAEDAKKTISKLIKHLKTVNEQLINDIIFNEPTLEYDKVMYVFESIVAEIERHAKKEQEVMQVQSQSQIEQQNYTEQHYPQAHNVGGTHMTQASTGTYCYNTTESLDFVQECVECTNGTSTTYMYKLPQLKQVIERAEDMQYQNKKKLREILVQKLYDLSGETYDNKFKYSYLQFVGHALSFKQEDIQKLLCEACEAGAKIASKDPQNYHQIVDMFTSSIVSNGYAVSKVTDFQATTLFNVFNDYGYLALQFDNNFKTDEILSSPKLTAHLFTNSCNRIFHVISNENIVILNRLTQEIRQNLMKKSYADTLSSLLKFYMDQNITELYGKQIINEIPLNEQVKIPQNFYGDEPIDGLFILNNLPQIEEIPKCIEELNFKTLLFNGNGKFILKTPQLLQTLSLMNGEVVNIKDCINLQNIYLRYNTLDLTDINHFKHLKRIYFYHVVFQFGPFGPDILRALRNNEDLQYVWLYTADQPEIQQLNLDFRLSKLRFLSVSYYNANPNNQVNIYVNKAGCKDLELVDIGNGELKLINGVVPNLVFLDCSNKQQIQQ